MLGYCRLTSLKRRKETNNDSQAHYLRFYSIHGAGTDARRDEEAGRGDGEGPVREPDTDPAGDASILIEAR